MTESEIQETVAKILDSMDLVWCHVPNEAIGVPGKRYAAYMVRQGVKKGVPDILIFNRPLNDINASGIALEMKSKKGSVSKHQIQWALDLTKHGWKFYVCYGTWDAIRALKSCGWDTRDIYDNIKKNLNLCLNTEGKLVDLELELMPHQYFRCEQG